MEIWPQMLHIYLSPKVPFIKTSVCNSGITISKSTCPRVVVRDHNRLLLKAAVSNPNDSDLSDVLVFHLFQRGWKKLETALSYQTIQACFSQLLLYTDRWVLAKRKRCRFSSNHYDVSSFFIYIFWRTLPDLCTIHQVCPGYRDTDVSHLFNEVLAWD